MKKITLFLLLLCFSFTVSAQVLNQSAAWPNTNWTVTGTYNAAATAFEADPTLTANFAFDDDDAGAGSDDDIAAESPIIDLSAAFTAGETWLFVDVDYTYNDLGDVLNLEYWDADSSTWVAWQQFVASADQPLDNFCSGGRDSFTSNQLNIAGFTATQLSGFQYRIAFYDDGPGGADGYEWGFCFDAPTISSQAPPTCPDPEMLSAANFTASSGELSWIESGSATVWNIEIVIAGNAPTGTPTVTVASNPYVATGLSASTNYEFYVQSDCGGDFSNWVGPFAFATECATFTAPFTEDFENGGTIPLCWAMDGGENWLFSDTGAGNHIGNNGTITGTTASNNFFAWVDSSGNDGVTTLTSPFIDVSGLTDPALSFYELSNNEGNANSTLDVEVWDGAAWNNVGTYNTNTVGWELKIINLSGLTITGDVQVRFIFSETVTGDFYDDIAIDDVTLDEAPSCFIPSFLTASNITTTTADLAWTEGGSATQWNIEVVIAGDAPTGTPTVSGVTNPYTVTGLSPSTSYEYYVQADCGGGDLSDWAGPFAFLTECATYIAPYTEDFENGGTIPICWSMDGGEDWLFSDTGAGNHIGDNGTIIGGTASNNYFAYVDSSGNDGVSTLTSPFVDVTGLTNPALSFYELSDNEDNANSTLDVEVWDGAAWNNVGTYNTNTVGWELKIIDLSGLTITGDVQARFIFSETVTGDFYDDIAIDDVTFDEAPTCFAPTLLTATNLSLTSTEVGWTEAGTAAEWNIEYGESGFAQGTGTVESGVTTNPYVINGLMPDTYYEFYVQAVCGPGDESTYSGPFEFFTGYCLSEPTSLDGNGVGNVTIGVTDFPSLGDDVTYENHTSPVVNVFQGINTNVAITFETGFTYGTNIWIDFNDDLVFDNTTELVYQGESTNANPTTLDASFIMPITAPLGQHRMRIGTADTGQATPDPCYNGSWGVTLDFTVNIQQLTCTLPEATFTTTTDCNTDQFYIDVDVTSMGDATTLEISNDLDATTVQATAVGVYQAGPFPFGNTVKVFVMNEQDNNCIISSESFTVLACPPDNDVCETATVAVVNDNGTCDLTTPGTILAATPSGVPSGSCNGNPDDDVWFEFTALSEVQIISLNNIAGGTFNIDHAVYEGACGALTEIYCSDDEASVTPQLVVGNTYYIRVFSSGSQPESSTFDLCIRAAPTNIICENAENFCSVGGALTTPNIVGIPSDGQIACLFTAPNPVWNIIQIGDPGTIEIQINQQDANGNGLDVDFVIWGPFNSVTQACTDIIFADCPTCPNNTTDPNFYPFGNIIDCSYSAASVENLTIDNAQTGEIYMLLVTNYNGNPGDITIEQTNIGGTNNGTITAEIEAELTSLEVFIDDTNDPAETDEVSVCGYPSVTIETDSPFADEFIWYRNGFVMPGETGPSITVTESDNYQVQAFDNQCGTDAFSQLVIVNLYEDPGTVAPQTYVVCDGPVADGEESFDLDQLTTDLGFGADFTVSYYTNMADANQAMNAVSTPYTSSGETLIIRVEDADAANDGYLGCRQLSEVQLVVNPNPVINQPVDFVVCDDADGNVDGQTEFNLTSIDPEVSTDPNVTITYHNSQDDADSGNGPIASPYTSGGETIYVRAVDNTTGCHSTTSFNLVVNVVPLATFDPQFDYEVCPNATVPVMIGIVPSNFTAADVTVNWFLDGTPIAGNGLVLDSVLVQGDYSAEITFNATGCVNTITTFVMELESCIIPQGISPGVSDGQNDTFDLSSYNVTRLEIFNRNGTLVYSKNNYINEWHGQTNDGEELPVGTYFYTMIYEGGAKKRSAWIYINR